MQYKPYVVTVIVLLVSIGLHHHLSESVRPQGGGTQTDKIAVGAKSFQRLSNKVHESEFLNQNSDKAKVHGRGSGK